MARLVEEHSAAEKSQQRKTQEAERADTQNKAEAAKEAMVRRANKILDIIEDQKFPPEKIPAIEVLENAFNVKFAQSQSERLQRLRLVDRYAVEKREFNAKRADSFKAAEQASEINERASNIRADGPERGEARLPRSRGYER